jgi:hypothetical protein
MLFDDLADTSQKLDGKGIGEGVREPLREKDPDGLGPTDS